MNQTITNHVLHSKSHTSRGLIFPREFSVIGLFDLAQTKRNKEEFRTNENYWIFLGNYLLPVGSLVTLAGSRHVPWKSQWRTSRVITTVIHRQAVWFVRNAGYLVIRVADEDVFTTPGWILHATNVAAWLSQGIIVGKQFPCYESCGLVRVSAKEFREGGRGRGINARGTSFLLLKYVLHGGARLPAGSRCVFFSFFSSFTLWLVPMLGFFSRFVLTADIMRKTFFLLLRCRFVD